MARTIKLISPDNHVLQTWKDQPLQVLKSYTAIFGNTENETFRMFDKITHIVVAGRRVIIGYVTGISLVIIND